MALNDLLAEGRIVTHPRSYGGQRLSIWDLPLEVCAVDDATRDRHLAWYVKLAERLGPMLTGGEADVVMDLLQKEAENLRSAIYWGLEREDTAEAVLRLMNSTHWFWYYRAPDEGVAILEEALEKAAHLHEVSTLRAVNLLASLHLCQGRFEVALDTFNRLLCLAEALGNEFVSAAAYVNAALCAYEVRPWVESDDYYRRGIALLRKVNAGSRLGPALLNYGINLLRENLPDEARPVLQEAEAYISVSGDLIQSALLLGAKGSLALAENRYEAAAEYYSEHIQSLWALRCESQLHAAFTHILKLNFKLGRFSRVAVLAGIRSFAYETLGYGEHFKSLAQSIADMAQVQQVLGDRFDTLWHQGYAMSLDQAVTFAAGACT